MGLRINDIAPDFTAESTQGTIRFHDWVGDGYAIIFSPPARISRRSARPSSAPWRNWRANSSKRKTKVIGVSVDSVADHQKWKRDIEAFAGAPADFPIIDDTLADRGQGL